MAVDNKVHSKPIAARVASSGPFAATPEAEIELAQRIAHHDAAEHGRVNGNDRYREIQRLETLAKSGSFGAAADPQRIARLAFAFKHGIESILPSYRKDNDALGAMTRAAASDGVLTNDEREQIAKQAGSPATRAQITPHIDPPPGLGTGPRGEADLQHYSESWTKAFGPQAMSALAIERANAEIARVKDLNRAATALGVSLRNNGTPAQFEKNATSQIVDASVNAANSAARFSWKSASVAADIGGEAMRLLASANETDRVRGNLILRAGVQPNFVDFRHSPPLGRGDAARDLAITMVNKLSEAQLGTLEPGTVAALVGAITDSGAIVPTDGLADERSETARLFPPSGAFPTQHDETTWDFMFIPSIGAERNAAIERLQQHAPKTMSIVKNETGGWRVTYQPPAGI